jgi:hypothetical protein
MSASSADPAAVTPAVQAPFSAERWRQFWDHWKAQPQQLAGIEQLRQAVMAADPQVLTEAALWRQTFSSAPPAPTHANPLPVAWENQNDNASGTGYRECFSSSCAMLARFWGKVSGDDAYNVIRARYGATLEEQIKHGRPVAVGWLHHGPASAPSGGGHWSVVIGFTETVAIHNDPNGEADLVHGGYTANTNGAGQHYSWKNWLPRWQADGPGTGWLLTCHP